jgi:hypothetical protein
VSFKEILGKTNQFIFGGNTGTSYEDLQAKRRAAQQHAKQISQGGFHGLANGIVTGVLRGQARKGEKAGREDFNGAFQQLLANKLGGGEAANLYGNPFANDAHKAMIKNRLPAYRHGTSFHPGGQALVGEDGGETATLPDGRRVRIGANGPEVVDMPRGAQVQPNPMTTATQAVPAGLDAYDVGGPASNPSQHMGSLRNEINAMSPDEIEAIRGYDHQSRERMQLDQENPTPPAGFNPRDLIGDQSSLRPQSSFAPDAEYRVADMSGFAPSGTGEKNQLHGAARSFQGFMKSLSDYETTFNNGGSTMWPGKRRDELSIGHRDLQMQLKELYNLGVLNGPDLDLMNQILLDPTSISGNVMDGLGGPDMEERIPANIAQVRELMVNRTTPALQQLGIDPKSLMPQSKRRRYDPATGAFVEAE